jgi:hypothetical protein
VGLSCESGVVKGLYGSGAKGGECLDRLPFGSDACPVWVVDTGGVQSNAIAAVRGQKLGSMQLPVS